MVRTRWWLGIPVAVLAGCGSGSGSGGEPEAGSSSAGSSSAGSSSAGSSPAVGAGGVSAGDWTLPTGVFRSDNPETGVLELHVDVGRFRQYEGLETPELGYAADCVADDVSTITCTEATGVQLVFAWSGTDDSFRLEVLQGFDDDRRVWEGAPWVRVP